jgi:ketosteroid isomerase-like protein
MRSRRSLILGVACGLGAQALVRQILLIRFRRDVQRLNEGDYGSLLGNYAEDALLRFNDGPHRFAGEHRGKAAIERFFQDFVAAGVHGELKGLWVAGPPWALTLAARFDDEASAPDGERLYENQAAMVVRTRWGKIVEHEDFFADTARILAFEQALGERGIESVAPLEQPAST